MNFISEQQKEIVESDSKYKLISGCAGSNKTDTLIKCAVLDLNKNERPISFLTLVGSVTDELIIRLEKRLGITINKQGISNHYIGYYKNIPICISNYDAWVHNMLSDMDLTDIGNCYSEKIDILCKKTQTENMICYMKNKIKIGLLIIDEVQDLPSNKMKIITNLSLYNKDLAIYVAGDYLQTLYIDDNTDLSSVDFHSMNIFKRINPAYYDLSICMRCPKAHVDFNNLLMNDIQNKYFIPSMKTNNDNTIDKPLLFTHLPTTNNTQSRIIAEQVTNMIKILLEKDVSITPDDIAIIMSKTNENKVFYQLEDTLNKLYISLGYKNYVYHMSTNGDGRRNTLDWNKAKGKTKMLSIHGDKGRGHKVVFFLGVTENSIPKESNIFKPSEIVCESLLNVGLTRSFKYLFIGFCGTFPSRYLLKKKDELSSYVYKAWEKEDDVPEPYKSIIANQYNNKPYWQNKNYRMEKIIGGIKTQLQVKNDISKNFEQTKNLIMYPWKKNVTTINFGKKQKIQSSFHEEHYLLLGLMAEILIQRILNKTTLFGMVNNASIHENNIYTDDERFLSCMYDIHNEENLETYFNMHSIFFNKNPYLISNINNAIKNKKNVIHTIFKSQSFKKDLEEFLSSKKNEELSSECIWNVTVFYNQFTKKTYRPSTNACLGFFNEDISVLHNNIDLYIIKYLKGNNILFENDLYLKGVLTNEELLSIKKDPTKDTGLISLRGRYDIYDYTNYNLFEIKASCIKDYSQEWLIQITIYTTIMEVYKIPVKTMFIVNILTGCLWKWNVNNLHLPIIEELISSKISKKYEFHKLETKALINGIKKIRKSIL